MDEKQSNSPQLFNTENVTENKGNAETGTANDLAFEYTIEQAHQYFLDHGFDVAPRTITHYCKTHSREFQCEKFPDTAQHVRRWLITKASLEHHLKELQKDAQASASNSSSDENSMQTGARKETPPPRKRSSANVSKYAEMIEVPKIYVEELEKDKIELTDTVAELRKGIGALNEAVQLSSGLGGLLKAATDKLPMPDLGAKDFPHKGEKNIEDYNSQNNDLGVK